MFGNSFGNLFDSGVAFGAVGNAAAQASPGTQQQSQLARNMMGQGWYNQAGAAMQSQYNAAAAHQNMIQELGRYKKEWMVNGVAMTFTEFLDEIAPGDDNSLRTFLILKYKDTK